MLSNNLEQSDKNYLHQGKLKVGQWSPAFVIITEQQWLLFFAFSSMPYCMHTIWSVEEELLQNGKGLSGTFTVRCDSSGAPHDRLTWMHGCASKRKARDQRTVLAGRNGRTARMEVRKTCSGTNKLPKRRTAGLGWVAGAWLIAAVASSWHEARQNETKSTQSEYSWRWSHLFLITPAVAHTSEEGAQVGNFAAFN